VPQGNRETDRLAGILKGKLFSFLMEHKDDWEEAQVPWSWSL
jgi:hypothetical protein